MHLTFFFFFVCRSFWSPIAIAAFSTRSLLRAKKTFKSATLGSNYGMQPLSKICAPNSPPLSSRFWTRVPHTTPPTTTFTSNDDSVLFVHANSFVTGYESVCFSLIAGSHRVCFCVKQWGQRLVSLNSQSRGFRERCFGVLIDKAKVSVIFLDHGASLTPFSSPADLQPRTGV